MLNNFVIKDFKNEIKHNYSNFISEYRNSAIERVNSNSTFSDEFYKSIKRHVNFNKLGRFNKTCFSFLAEGKYIKTHINSKLKPTVYFR